MSKPDDELIPPPPPSFVNEVPSEPEYDYDGDVDPRLVPGQQFGQPPALHDSERLQPPPVSGSID